jgi:hypothetical protein
VRGGLLWRRFTVPRHRRRHRPHTHRIHIVARTVGVFGGWRVGRRVPSTAVWVRACVRAFDCVGNRRVCLCVCARVTELPRCRTDVRAAGQVPRGRAAVQGVLRAVAVQGGAVPRGMPARRVVHRPSSIVHRGDVTTAAVVCRLTRPRSEWTATCTTTGCSCCRWGTLVAWRSPMSPVL